MRASVAGAGGGGITSLARRLVAYVRAEPVEACSRAMAQQNRFAAESSCQIRCSAKLAGFNGSYASFTWRWEKHHSTTCAALRQRCSTLVALINRQFAERLRIAD